MNDVPFQVHNGKLQYDNDTALICAAEEYREVLNYVTIDLRYIFLIRFPQVRCSLTLPNPVLCGSHLSPSITVSMFLLCTTLLQTKSHHQGVMFDDKLEWSSHVSTICFGLTVTANAFSDNILTNSLDTP